MSNTRHVPILSRNLKKDPQFDKANENDQTHDSNSNSVIMLSRVAGEGGLDYAGSGVNILSENLTP